MDAAGRGKDGRKESFIDVRGRIILAILLQFSKVFFYLTWVLLKNTRQRTKEEGRSRRILRAEVTNLQLTSVDAARACVTQWLERMRSR